MNLKEQRVKPIHEVLNENSERKAGKILSREPVSRLRILISLLLTVLVFVAIVVFHITKSNYNLDEKVFHVVWHSLIVLFFLAMVDTFLSVTNRVIDPTGKTKSFLAYALNQNIMLFRITLSLALYILCLALTSWIKNILSPVPLITNADDQPVPLVSAFEDDAKQPSTAVKEEIKKAVFEEYIEQNYQGIVFAVLIFFLTFLLKRLFLQFINYRIHFKYYKDRIKENKKIVQYLQSLNDITGTEANQDMSEWNNRIFDSMRKDQEVLSKRDFQRCFGVHDGAKIFQLFDIDENDEVTRDEFTKRYSSLFREKEQLDAALVQNSYGLYKLDCIVSIILFPLMILLILFTLGTHAKFQGVLKLVSTVLLSVSFAFSSVVSNVFQSIIFVFFVRPFDIGDIIEVDNKIYTVSDLGLLYSTLLSDSRYETFPNESLRTKCIKNLRKSTHVTAEFENVFSYKDYSKINDLKEKISNFLLDNPTKYEEKFRINNFKILKDEKMKFKIEIILSCPYQEIETIIERKDKFALFLHDTVSELEFTYV